MIEQIIEELESEFYKSEKKLMNRYAFQNKKRAGDNLMMCCPFHEERHPSFGITYQFPFLYNCFSCGEKGNIFTLISYVFDVSFEQANQIFYTKFMLLDKSIQISFDDKIAYSSINYKPHLSQKSLLYLQRRGFSKRTIEKYELGGDDEHVLIPVRDDKGNIRFIKQRSIQSKMYLNEKDVEKKNILYGFYYLITAGKTEEIFITEGEFDTLACYQMKLPAVSLMGSKLFKEQIELLLMYGVKKITLFLDNDETGFKSSMEIYKRLMRYPFKINFVLYPPPRWGIDTKNPLKIKIKDPNDVLINKEKIEVISAEKLLLLKGVNF